VVPIVQANPGGSALAPSSGQRAHPAASTDEWQLVDAVRAGDEAAFVALVGRLHPSLARLARLYVAGDEADDLTQDVWAGLLRDLDGLDRAGSLRVALFSILIDRARARRPVGAETVPFAAQCSGLHEGMTAPAADPALFQSSGPWVGHWAAPVPAWAAPADDPVAARQQRILVEATIDALPAAQREVVTLYDVAGWTPDEVCCALGITATTRRVLLHRARTAIRAALAGLFQER
jgi:RNA polymerase sigma-70 factor (ECF subfamily)